MASNVNMIIICLNNIKLRELKLRKKSETSIQSYAYFEELQKKTMKLDLLCSRHMLSGLILDDLSPPLLLTLCALATGSAKHSKTGQNGLFLHQSGVGAQPSGAGALLGFPYGAGAPLWQPRAIWTASVPSFLRSLLKFFAFHPPFALEIILDPPSRQPTYINTKHIKKHLKLEAKSI